jgi:hypothetical protein
MAPARRLWIPIALCVILGAVLVVGGLRLWAWRAEQAEIAQAMAATPVKATGPRIWYNPDHYPHLSLPGGKQETIRSILNVKKKLHYGEFVWNDQYVPKGPLWVRVDLHRQLISVFRDGHEIGTAVILYGAESKETPNGTFPILQKAADYHSITYDAPMPYMLRLTQDGVAIHGSDVRRGAATHGCIGVPIGFAHLLFDQMNLGDPVVIVGKPS